MRPLKWILIVAAALVALLLAGVLAITQWVDPNVFKPRIVAALRAATGRPVALPGDLELAWFPWLALRTGEGSLGNPEGFTGPPLLRWREARLGARLLPLLRGEFELDRVRLTGVALELRRDAAGRDNWSGLADAAGGGDRRGAPALRLAGLDLQDARLAFTDETDGTALALESLQLTSGAWQAGQSAPLPLTARFTLRVGREALPRLEAAQLETALGLPSGAASAITLGRTTFAARAFAAGLARDGVPFSLAMPGATLDPGASTYAAPALDVELGDAKLALRTLRYAQPGESPAAADVTFALAPTSLRALLATLGVAPPTTTDPRALESFAAEGRVALRDGTLQLEPLALTLDETRLVGRVVRSGEPALAEFTLAGNTMNLDRYLEPEGTPGEPFRFPGAALGALRARGTLTFDTATFDDLKFEGLVLRLQLDEQGLHGGAAR